MARDPGFEAMIAEDLAGMPGLATKAMFGGLVWLRDGHLLCGARHDGMLVRLGAGRDGWALALPGIAPMGSAGRTMRGWVWADEDCLGDDALRRRLIEAALAFVRSLPTRAAPPGHTPWDFPDRSDAAPAVPRRRGSSKA